MLFGALIAQRISSPFSAILLAFLGHYFLDFFPHIEYSIENIKNKNWKKSLPDFLKIFLDFLIGIALIFALSNNQPIIYVCAFLAILPDGLSMLGYVLKNNFLDKHNDFHQIKLHYLKNKKISLFWRIFSQIIIIVICVFLLKN
jgi:hypothetical protein